MSMDIGLIVVYISKIWYKRLSMKEGWSLKKSLCKWILIRSKSKPIMLGLQLELQRFKHLCLKIKSIKLWKSSRKNRNLYSHLQGILCWSFWQRIRKLRRKWCFSLNAVLCLINLQKKLLKLLKFVRIIWKLKKLMVRGKESKISVWLWVKCKNNTMFLKEGLHMCHMLESLWIDWLNRGIKVQVLSDNHLRWKTMCLKEMKLLKVPQEGIINIIIHHGWIGTCQKHSGEDIKGWEKVQSWSNKKNSGIKPSVFYRIIESSPLGFEKKISQLK